MPSIVDADVDRVLDRIDVSATVGGSLLITGSTGIIGSHLLATLLEAQRRGQGPDHITAVTRSGVSPWPVEQGRGLSVLAGDLTDPAFLASVPVADLVIHAAGYGQPAKFTSAPLASLEINTTATLGLVKKVRPGGRLLFLSTSEVYSGLAHPPFTEDQIGTTNPNHARAAYIEGKRAGEAIVVSAARELGIHGSSARVALAYGPGTRVDDGRVLNDFIRKALLEGRIALRDDGSAMRTYCYVSDAVEMLLAILLAGTEDVYNVGGQSRTSVAGLARLVGEIAGAEVDIPEADHGAAGAPDDVWIDLTRVLGLAHKGEFISLPEGVSQTVAWQRELFRSEGMST